MLHSSISKSRHVSVFAGLGLSTFFNSFRTFIESWLCILPLVVLFIELINSFLVPRGQKMDTASRCNLMNAKESKDKHFCQSSSYASVSTKDVVGFLFLPGLMWSLQTNMTHRFFPAELFPRLHPPRCRTCKLTNVNLTFQLHIVPAAQFLQPV